MEETIALALHYATFPPLKSLLQIDDIDVNGMIEQFSIVEAIVEDSDET